MPFDATAFMTQNIDRPMETEVKLVPVGEYQAMIDHFGEEAFQNHEFEYKKGDRAGQPGEMVNFNLPFIIQDAKAAEAIGRTDGKCTVYKRMTLDFDDTGNIDFGVNRNIELGRVRKAVDQNKPGSWNVSELRGAGPVIVKVEHRSYKRKDGTAGKSAEVTSVVAIRK